MKLEVAIVYEPNTSRSFAKIRSLGDKSPFTAFCSGSFKYESNAIQTVILGGEIEPEPIYLLWTVLLNESHLQSIAFEKRLKIFCLDRTSQMEQF